MRFDSVLTTCPFCGTGCNLFLEVMDGEVVGVSPVKWHPISRGKLCILGRNAHKFIHHPDRLTAPLKRVGDRFEKISWQQAFDEIAEKIAGIRDRFGPDALGFFSSAKCTNEENYLMMKLARGVVGTNNVDHCARLCHSSTVTGLAASFGAGAMTNSIPEIPETACMLVTGSNPTSQHPIIAGWMLEAKERGARLIVIDPREIPLSQHADLFLQLKPGTNIALFNGMARVILEKGLVNRDFINSRTEGLEELEAKVRDYDLERVSRITGVDAELIEKAAIMYASSPSAMIFYAMGITQHVTGTDNVKAVANLALLTGNVGRPSTGVNPLRGQNNVQGACDMGALPNVLTGYRPVTDAQARLEYAHLWGCDDLPAKPGLTIVEMSDAAAKGDLRGLIIMGENPAVTDPDINHLKKALSSLELLVVIDIFLTETAQLAHYILPAATFAEKEGTFTNTDRRVQRVRKAVDPPGEAKADWEILCGIARSLGSKSFEYGSPKEIMNEIRKLTPSYRGITYERLDRGESLQWPCPGEDHPGTPYLHAEAFPRGKGRFYGVEYMPAPEEPDDDYPLILTTGRVPYHWHGGSITRRIDSLNAEMPTGFADLNPADAARLGLKDGDLIRVSSRRGSISIRARISSEVKAGVVFIPMHFSECAANVLTDHKVLDPYSKIPGFKVCAVRVEKDTAKSS